MLQSIPTLADQRDEELVSLFHQGHSDALDVLITRYRRFARSKAQSYFVLGADSDDVEQEGMIGLFKAARDYRFDRQTSFRAFAEVCVTRQVMSAIKAATRHKHQPLNRYVSISAAGAGDERNQQVEALLDDHRAADPADEVVSTDQLVALRRSMADVLSGLEVDVLALYAEGQSYEEIGAHLGRHPKSVDNALQRIKRKISGHMAADDSFPLAPEAMVA